MENPIGRYFSLGNTIYIPNNQVACKPFPNVGLQTQGSGFITIKQKTSLLETEVIWGNETFARGMKVCILGDDHTMIWTKTVYNRNGTEFILVPCNRILLVEIDPDLQEKNW